MLRVTTSPCPHSHKHPPHPWSFGTEAFVGRKRNIAAAPGPGCIPWQCTLGDLGVLCFLGRKTAQNRAHGRQKKRTNHPQRTCEQAKSFPEHVGWMAQLLPPESSLPAFPAGLFLPPLDGSGAAITPLRASRVAHGATTVTCNHWRCQSSDKQAFTPHLINQPSAQRRRLNLQGFC